MESFNGEPEASTGGTTKNVHVASEIMGRPLVLRPHGAKFFTEIGNLKLSLNHRPNTEKATPGHTGWASCCSAPISTILEKVSLV